MTEIKIEVERKRKRKRHTSAQVVVEPNALKQRLYDEYSRDGKILGDGGYGIVKLTAVLRKKSDSLQEAKRKVMALKRTFIDLSTLRKKYNLPDRVMIDIKSRFKELILPFIKNPFLSDFEERVTNLGYQLQKLHPNSIGNNEEFIDSLLEVTWGAVALFNENRAKCIYATLHPNHEMVRREFVTTTKLANIVETPSKEAKYFSIDGRPNAEEEDVALDTFSDVQVASANDESQVKNFQLKKPKEQAQQLLNVLVALKVLHDNRYTHRDIKPGNLFITHNGNYSLADFGGLVYGGDRSSVFTPEYTPDYLLANNGYKSDLPNFEDRMKADLFALSRTFIDILYSNGGPSSDETTEINKYNRYHGRPAEMFPPDFVNEFSGDKSKLQAILKFMNDEDGYESVDEVILDLLKYFPDLVTSLKIDPKKRAIETFTNRAVPVPAKDEKNTNLAQLNARKKQKKQKTLFSKNSQFTLLEDSNTKDIFYLQQNENTVGGLKFEVGEDGFSLKFNGQKLMKDTLFREWTKQIGLSLPLKIYDFEITNDMKVQDVISGVENELKKKTLKDEIRELKDGDGEVGLNIFSDKTFTFSLADIKDKGINMVRRLRTEWLDSGSKAKGFKIVKSQNKFDLYCVAENDKLYKIARGSEEEIIKFVEAREKGYGIKLTTIGQELNELKYSLKSDDGLNILGTNEYNLNVFFSGKREEVTAVGYTVKKDGESGNFVLYYVGFRDNGKVFEYPIEGVEKNIPAILTYLKQNTVLGATTTITRDSDKADKIVEKRREAKLERIEAERIEAKRVEAERLKAEKIKAERIEAKRIEAKRIEAERLKAERTETERRKTERIKEEKKPKVGVQLKEMTKPPIIHVTNPDPVQPTLTIVRQVPPALPIKKQKIEEVKVQKGVRNKYRRRRKELDLLSKSSEEVNATTTQQTTRSRHMRH
jgi:serine/threonine protein kinase